jgi:hypothetical protein
MSIVEVILNVCLITTPASCEQKTTVFGPFDSYQLTQEECESNGLVVAKNFLEDHQEWAVVGWKCQQKVDPTK